MLGLTARAANVIIVRNETDVTIVGISRPLDMKGCICHFVKWQINTFISKQAVVIISDCDIGAACSRYRKSIHPKTVVSWFYWLKLKLARVSCWLEINNPSFHHLNSIQFSLFSVLDTISECVYVHVCLYLCVFCMYWHTRNEVHIYCSFPIT